MSSPDLRRLNRTDLAAHARACAMGMRPGRRPPRGSMCSTQNWGLVRELLIEVVYPIFPCFQPDILIGAHTHGTRSGASKVGLAGCCDVLGWWAGGLAGRSDRLYAPVNTRALLQAPAHPFERATYTGAAPA